MLVATGRTVEQALVEVIVISTYVANNNITTTNKLEENIVYFYFSPMYSKSSKVAICIIVILSNSNRNARDKNNIHISWATRYGFFDAYFLELRIINI